MAGQTAALNVVQAARGHVQAAILAMSPLLVAGEGPGVGWLSREEEADLTDELRSLIQTRATLDDIMSSYEPDPVE